VAVHDRAKARTCIHQLRTQMILLLVKDFMGQIALHELLIPELAVENRGHNSGFYYSFS
jgi:hypothetical protein